MRKILSCEFNLDTACVELCLEDGTLPCYTSTLPQVVRRTGDTKSKRRSVRIRKTGVCREYPFVKPLFSFAKNIMRSHEFSRFSQRDML